MTTITEAVIEADPTLPIIHTTRDFRATPEQLFRAHTDPDLFAQWIGPERLLPAWGESALSTSTWSRSRTCNDRLFTARKILAGARSNQHAIACVTSIRTSRSRLTRRD